MLPIILKFTGKYYCVKQMQSKIAHLCNETSNIQYSGKSTPSINNVPMVPDYQLFIVAALTTKHSKSFQVSSS